MKEFEYSFVVESPTPYHEYCAEICDEPIRVVRMRRRIYKDVSGVIARLTREIDVMGEKKCYLDFKEDSNDTDLIKNVLESKKILFSEGYFSVAERLLAKLHYRLTSDLEKERTTYWIKGVRVDIDAYRLPSEAFVVELEGKEGAARQLYTRMMKTLNNTARDK